ncbi:MAG: hypothetical protein KH295_01975 [Clostridiaceae bacterium]|nr:hypothetical protein [Clostridiaceae bacterium]
MAALIKTMIEKWVALYVRLSRDDENEGDSNSIAHQEFVPQRLSYTVLRARNFTRNFK